MAFCIHCGKPLMEGARFCAFCGGSATGYNAVTSAQDEQPEIAPTKRPELKPAPTQEKPVAPPPPKEEPLKECVASYESKLEAMAAELQEKVRYFFDATTESQEYDVLCTHVRETAEAMENVVDEAEKAIGTLETHYSSTNNIAQLRKTVSDNKTKYVDKTKEHLRKCMVLGDQVKNFPAHQMLSKEHYGEVNVAYLNEVRAIDVEEAGKQAKLWHDAMEKGDLSVIVTIDPYRLLQYQWASAFAEVRGVQKTLEITWSCQLVFRGRHPEQLFADQVFSLLVYSEEVQLNALKGESGSFPLLQDEEVNDPEFLHNFAAGYNWLDATKAEAYILDLAAKAAKRK